MTALVVDGEHAPVVPERVFAFAWSPDGTRIAVTGAGSVAEISADDGRVLARHPGRTGGGLAWLPD